MTKLIGLMLCLLALCGAAGCANVQMTPDTLAALAAAGGAASGQLMVPKPISPALAAKILPVIDEVRPIAQGIQTVEAIQTVLVPAISRAVQQYIPDVTVQSVVTAALTAGVSIGQSYLTTHPDVAKQLGVAGYVTDAALLGFRNGLVAGIAGQEGGR